MWALGRTADWHVPAGKGYGADEKEPQDVHGYPEASVNFPALQKLLKSGTCCWPKKCRLPFPPWEVTVPAQNTGLGWKRTSLFQAFGYHH